MKSNLASYLEERNQSTNLAGNNDYQTTSDAGQPFNDILYCIGQSGSVLAAVPCP